MYSTCYCVKAELIMHIQALILFLHYKYIYKYASLKVLIFRDDEKEKELTYCLSKATFIE